MGMRLAGEDRVYIRVGKPRYETGWVGRSEYGYEAG